MTKKSKKKKKELREGPGNFALGVSASGIAGESERASEGEGKREKREKGRGEREKRKKAKESERWDEMMGDGMMGLMK